MTDIIHHPDPKPHSEEDRRLNTLGFAIYDLIHIFCSISFLVLVIKENANVALDSGALQASILLEMADEFTELILSFTLIFFVVFIYKAKTASNARSLYSFAWLLVSLSLLIPSTFEIPILYMFPWPAQYGMPLYVFLNIDTYIPAASFICFLICLALIQKEKRWRIALDIGMVFLCLFSFSSLTVYILEEQATGGLSFSYQTFCRFLFCFAPLVPSIMTFISLYNKEKIPEANKLVKQAKLEIEKEKEDVRI
jgi:hypothetical protein